MTPAKLQRRALSGLALFVLMGSAVGQQQGGNDFISLGVPLVAQKGHSLCWAACTHMVMKYVHDSLDQKAEVWTQCALARHYFIALNSIPPIDSAKQARLADTAWFTCPSDTIPAPFNQSGFPFMGDTARFPAYSCVIPATFTWDSLHAAIASKHPVIFQWVFANSTYDSGGQHDMVAEGCSTFAIAPQEQWVSVHDPWPVDSEAIGRHEQISFDEFMNTPNTKTPWGKVYYWYSQGQVYVAGRREK